MESMTTSEIIDRINEIEAVQGKHLRVACEVDPVFLSEGESEEVEVETTTRSVVEVKYRASGRFGLPYIALICR